MKKETGFRKLVERCEKRNDQWLRSLRLRSCNNSDIILLRQKVLLRTVLSTAHRIWGADVSVLVQTRSHSCFLWSVFLGIGLGAQTHDNARQPDMDQKVHNEATAGQCGQSGV